VPIIRHGRLPASRDPRLVRLKTHRVGGCRCVGYCLLHTESLRPCTSPRTITRSGTQFDQADPVIGIDSETQRVLFEGVADVEAVEVAADDVGLALASGGGVPQSQEAVALYAVRVA
jgi:hypothetical protein